MGEGGNKIAEKFSCIEYDFHQCFGVNISLHLFSMTRPHEILVQILHRPTIWSKMKLNEIEMDTTTMKKKIFINNKNIHFAIVWAW